MTTNRSLGVLMLAALIGAPLAAGAQTPPTKPTPPVQTQPDPKVKPEPRTIVIPDIQLPNLDPLLSDLRWKALDDMSLKLSIDGRLLDLSGAQDAMDQARLAMEDAKFRLDWQDQNTPFRYVSTFKGEGDYSTGKDLLNQRKYTEAIARFDRVVAQKAPNSDGALYWKAYAQFKLGKTDESLATVAQLRKDYAQSRYLGDAKALEADARRRAGQPVNPAAMDDDDLKLLAINGIKNTDPEGAIPLLENVLNATNSLRVKKQALYVLGSMSNQPRAHQILVGYAKGGGNPDLQLEAIRYIAVGSDKQTTAAELMQIYQSTQDTDIKLAVIGALRSSGNKDPLIHILGSDGSPMILRSSALSGLSGVLGPTELMTLFEKETNKDLRLQIVGLLGSMDATDQLTRVIKSEKDQDVVRRAIRSLGNQPAAKTGQTLTDLYATEQDPATRRTVIAALGAQNNAEGLVAIARKESSLELKLEIVRRLSDMAPKSKVAADYLKEIIK